LLQHQQRPPGKVRPPLWRAAAAPLPPPPSILLNQGKTEFLPVLPPTAPLISICKKEKLKDDASKKIRETNGTQ
jgi:hypothetical protein